jgi:hypothetical protein
VSFDQKLRLAANILLMLAALNLLRVCASILFEHYNSLRDGEHKKREGDKHQSPSEIDNSASRNFGKLRSQSQNFAVVSGERVHDLGSRATKFQFIIFCAKPVNLFLNFFRVGIHK